MTTEARHLIQLFHYLWEVHHSSPGLLHDIANPLTTATSALESVLRDADPSVQYQPSSLNELTVSLECLQHIQAILRQGQGTQHLQPENFTFSLLREAQAAVHLYRWKSKQKRIRVHLKIPPGMLLIGNPVRFRQVLGNLLSNAIDASETSSSAHLSSILIHAQQQKRHQIISIKDSGRGIPAQTLDHIFAPFFTTKPQQKGTGIGLSIVKNILEKEFSGSIRVRSRIGKGTTFTLTLPL